MCLLYHVWAPRIHFYWEKKTSCDDQARVRLIQLNKTYVTKQHFWSTSSGQNINHSSDLEIEITPVIWNRNQSSACRHKFKDTLFLTEYLWWCLSPHLLLLSLQAKHSSWEQTPWMLLRKEKDIYWNIKELMLSVPAEIHFCYPIWVQLNIQQLIIFKLLSTNIQRAEKKHILFQVTHERR